MAERVIELEEYKTSSPVQLDQADLAVLAALPYERVQVSPTTMGWFTIRATSWVGALVLPSVTIRIRPKVDDLTNFLGMLAAGSGLPNWSAAAVGYAEDDLVEGIAELTLRTIDEATRRGLLHGYKTCQDRLPVLRGRLQVSVLASRPWDVWPAPCEYDEFTADIAENRVLLACVRLIRRWAAGPAARRLAGEIMSRLGEVSEPEAPLVEADLIQESPLNEHYRPALAFARIILEGHGVSHNTGAAAGHAFLLDMNKLYERWIGAELQARLWPAIGVEEQRNVALVRKPSVTMAPDLMFTRGRSDVLVGDVKYKLTGSGLARGSDYYQLLAYLTALKLKRGILIYCQAADAPPRTVTIEGSLHQITCYPLPLKGGPDDLDRALDELTATVLDLVA